MLRTSMTLIGLAGVAFLAGGFAFAGAGSDSLAQSQEILKKALLRHAATMNVKGDRLAAPVSAAQPTSVSIVEIIGVSQAVVILRSSTGEVIYRSDPRSGMTTLSKNVDLPILTMKEEMQSPTVQHPPATSQQQGGEETTRKEKRSTPVGCMGDVSPLARASANRMPSLCLASLDQPLS